VADREDVAAAPPGGTHVSTAWASAWPDERPLGGLRYGALGLPLAFVALPLYVILPNHYAEAFGVPLAALGLVLLGARLLDAFADPLIGRWADSLLGRSAVRAWAVTLAAAVVLAIGFRALFFPTVQGTANLLVWCAAMLAVTYLSFSTVTVVHQAWGARLGGDAPQRARVVAWREALSLAGVLVASVLPSVAGLSVTTVVFAVLLLAGVALLRVAPAPQASTTAEPAVPMSLPFRTPAFRKLLLIYLLNGIASAIPATLVLFFISDRLDAKAYEPMFLAGYFAAGALSIPLWVRVIRRYGLPRTWLAGMVLAIGVFVWAALLGTGDVWLYLAVCVLSGVALGADLTIPGAMLAGVIQRAGHGRQAEGAYFGWWNFATKLNLALAAGLALPALQWFGYEPGSRSDEALNALTLAYCLLPCLLKGAAVALLWNLWIKPSEDS
jgi:glycoside/pentoside/hexuronide:cation symporter, GPH family